MTDAGLASRLLRHLPFYYGWVVLACVCCACFARAGPAVATLSIFVEPMTSEFGWSRTGLSGAVSLGGILAAISSPLIGSFLDRSGARLVLCLAVLTTGIAIMLLATIQSLLAFYLLFCIARLNFAGPFDLGIYGALNNWFVTRRAVATSIVTLTQAAGLTLVPLIGFHATQLHGWRFGWLAIGAVVLLVGFLPTWLLMIRRPEDVGLLPDGAAPVQPSPAGLAATAARPEPAFTRAEALRTRAFWTLAIFTALIYPVQAGMSLHQAPHLIERGLSAAAAATTVSLFSLATALTGFGSGILLRWMSVRVGLAATGLLLAAGAVSMLLVSSASEAIVAGTLFGLGIGGVHTVLPVAWADYFGRRNFGAIRGVALTIQVAAQALGPLLSGILRDATGRYDESLVVFAVLSGLGVGAALMARPPGFGTAGPA